MVSNVVLKSLVSFWMAMFTIVESSIGAIAPSAIAQATVRVSFGNPGSFTLSFDTLFSSQMFYFVSSSTKYIVFLFPCQLNNSTKKRQPDLNRVGLPVVSL